MCRLIGFELEKIWKKKSFACAIGVLVLLNIFLLWYTNLNDVYTPSLSSYKAVQKQIAGMTEAEKMEYITEWKETIDEAYYDMYQTGDYLRFTETLEQEKVLVNEIYAELTKVAGYGEYLQSVQESKNALSGISIFAQQEENTFSFRNIEKSAQDYGKLKEEGIRFAPSKTITSAMESQGTDILLLLTVFLFTGGLIMEEKEKRLFYITRSTKYGITQSIFAKLLAVFIQCMILTALFYVINLLFFTQTAGRCDMTASLQSLAPYMESSLSISIGEYVLLSVFTKGMVLFGTGAVLTAFCILADNIILPYLVGFSIWGVSYILYTLIPAGSVLSVVKYINLAGLLKTENLYGAYLNFAVFSYPFSRLFLSWIVIILLAVTGIVASVILFSHGRNLELKNIQFPVLLHFKPHGNLLRHECYKIMITNGAAMILLALGLLIGYRDLNQQYHLSVYEDYYQGMMQQLEGELTEEKEDLILVEQARYDEAFENIERIDELVSAGGMSESAGDTMKIQWYNVTAFYPSFQRVQQQYENICERGGNFIYDTGYLYLFGKKDDSFLIDFMLITFGLILAFGNVIPMEEQSGAWNLLGATKLGKQKILFRKMLVCLLGTGILSLIPILCRFICISSTYTMKGFGFSVQDIPFCRDFLWDISVGGLIALFAVVQMLSAMMITLVILGISLWRKNHIQTIFFAVLLLAVPLVLLLLGFDFAGWFSIYPLYAWAAGV